jgi:hypothetical protein
VNWCPGSKSLHRWIPSRPRFRLFDAVARFLVAAAEPDGLVLVLDDLHAADAPSLLLLRFLAGEIAESRLLVLGCYRDADLEHHNGRAPGRRPTGSPSSTPPRSRARTPA